MFLCNRCVVLLAPMRCLRLIFLAIADLLRGIVCSTLMFYVLALLVGRVRRCGASSAVHSNVLRIVFLLLLLFPVAVMLPFRSFAIIHTWCRIHMILHESFQWLLCLRFHSHCQSIFHLVRLRWCQSSLLSLG